MRMWNVAPEKMCRRHLLGEHVEIHMFASELNAGKPLTGYLRNGLLEIHNLQTRHNALVTEMLRRGYRHASPLLLHTIEKRGLIDAAANLRELARRCIACRRLILTDLPEWWNR